MPGSHYTGEGTILGGLPVIADVYWGHSPWDGEGFAEIVEIYWRKRDGSKGKPIPTHLRDRAEKYDRYFCGLIEQLQDHCIHEAGNDEPNDEMVELIP
jgi:hypothetical protein